MSRLLALPGFLIGLLLAIPLLIIPALLAEQDE